ncbi:hypothetical protein MKW98_029346, partial [Papaver atlanticum]
LEVGYVAEFVRGKHDLLYYAIKDDDLEKTSEYLLSNPEAIKEGIAQDASTALHMALYWNKSTVLVEEIVKLMTPEILEYKTNNEADTALHLSAFRGNTEAVVLLVDKNPRLTQIRNKDRYTPLEVALCFVTAGQTEIVVYLYSVTRDVEPSPFSGHDGARLLCTAIEADFFDMALCIVKRFPGLITEKSIEHKMCGLELLVRKPLAFPSGTKLTWWQNHVYSLIQVNMNTTYTQLDKTEDIQAEAGSEASSTSGKGILMPCLTRVPRIINLYNKKLMHKQATALLVQMFEGIGKNAHTLQAEEVKFFQNNPDIIKVAIKHGIIEVIVEILKQFSSLIWEDISDQSMIEMAIADRNATMVSLICDSGDAVEDKISLVTTTDKDDNTILHHAAKIAPSAILNSISGVALQIQRELQWFKGIESMLPENDKIKRNKKGYTAQTIFTEEHSKLLKEGEDWMKDTSGSCMIVAALIATVAFAAAFTVPGGNISDNDSSKNGTPVFLGNASFTVFAVADAFALFSSITAVLMFLAIYTSRFGEMDFLKSLPQKLIIGLMALFISMAAILVAFCASLFIVVGYRFPRSLILIALFGCVPVALFACLQLPLFYEMVRSTYWGSLFQKHKYIDPRREKKKKVKYINPRAEKKKNKVKESKVSRVKKLIGSFWPQWSKVC